MALTYYAGNRITGVSGDTKPSSNIITGTTFLETNTDDLYIWDGDSWNIVASDTGAQTFNNKTFTDAITFKEMSAPGNQADTYGALYIKAKSSTNAIYFKSDDETEYDLTESAASGTLAGMTDTTITSPNDAAVLLYDTGTSTWRDADMSGIATIDDVGAMTLAAASITGQSAETTPQGASDLILMYDNSASALKKITVSNLLAGGVSSDTLAGLSDTTIASVASTQILIYDGTDSWDNKTVSGDITINTSGVTAIGTDKVTGTMIHANAVDDSSLEQNGTAFRVKASGITGTMLNANTVDDSSIELASNTLNVKASGVTNTMLAGSIANAKLANSSITVSDGSNTTAVALGGTVTFAATANETTVAESSGTVTIGLPDNVTIAGNLIVTGNSTVNGDTVTQNVATVSVEDPLIALASGNNAADAVDIGLYGLYDTSGSQDLYSGLFRDANDSGKWKLFKDLQATPTTTVNVSGTGYAVATLVADLEGDVTGTVSGNAGTVTNGVYTTGTQTIGGAKTFSTTIVGSVNGNAGTATALATGRTIAMTGDVTWTSASFDGSGNVTGVAAIASDVIINADVKSDAAIDYSKLAALTDGNILVGNGSNVATSVNPSGDVDITNAGVFSIAAGVIVNADVHSSAGIVDTKLATISTADKVAGGAIQIDSGTDGTGITIADTDKFLVDDGGTTKYVNASQLKTYAADGTGASESFAIAMAVAL